MKSIYFFNHKQTFNKIGGEYFSANRLKTLLKKKSYNTFYVNNLSLWKKKNLLKKNSILYFNGIFHKKLFFFLIINLFYKLNIIISPKGELLDGAIRIKKLKKKFFIFFLIFFLRKNINFHCTSNFEKNKLNKNFKNNKIFVARDLIESDFDNIKLKCLNLIKKKFQKKISKKQKLKVVFYSTINKKKNLKFAISIIKDLKRKVDFDIYGNTYDNKYLLECLEEVKEFKPNINCNYYGKVEKKEIYKILSNYDVFLFPTLAENFGYVVLEAFMSGCFILISKNTTPWSFLKKYDLLLEYEFNEKKKWYKFLENFDIKSFRSQTSIQKKYFNVIKKYFDLSEIEKENLKIFKNL